MIHLPAEEGRQEIKFVARDTDFHDLVRWIRLHHLGFRRPYPPRLVNNIYFDAPGFDSYLVSLAGVGSRAKVRYRWYGESSSPAPGRLEAKIKRGHVGWKLVWDVDDLLDGVCVEAKRLRSLILGQVPLDARPWLVEFSEPVLRNRYRRHYWQANLRDLRLTVDTGLSVFSLQRESGLELDRSLHIQRTLVVELKFRNDDRGRVAEMLQGMPLVACRNSKYCNGVAVIHEA